MQPRHEALDVPASSYRLQFHKDFGFAAARALLPYLRSLGIGAIYASPVVAARPSSPHGYDVADPARVSDELGGAAELDALGVQLRERGMGLILDIVPNHMGVLGGANPYWNDVLANGKSSRYAHYFDIDWRPAGRPDLAGKVLLPVLGDTLENVLARDELKLDRSRGPEPAEGALVLRYFEHELPLSDASIAALGASGEGTPDPPSRAMLERLLEAQFYRLDHWRTGARDLNYRRFFDISELAGVCVEDPRVFDAVHARILALLESGTASGLRVDHIDGLHDPAEYLERLQKAASEARGGRECYVLVEKILSPGEELEASWPVAGTTGYEVANLLQGLFVDPRGAKELRETHTRFTGDPSRFADVVREAKREVLETSLEAELERLAGALHELASGSVERRLAREALLEVLACFPVYRTYLSRDPETPRPADCKWLRQAFAEARRRSPELAPAALDALEQALFSEPSDMAQRDSVTHDQEQLEHRRRDFAMHFQQLSGPAMAKGFEDTALYRYFPLASLNDVGGDPERFGVSVAAFHDQCRKRLEAWPFALSASSTHDSKRGEDARARLSALSEIPGEWTRSVERFRKLNAPHRGAEPGGPTPAEEYLLYQTLVAAWPFDAPGAEELERFTSRIEEYLVKALREAKRTTSWIDCNAAHEESVRRFVRAILAPASPFRAELADFVRPLAHAGARSSLSLALLKIAMPGVPDVYQGAEAWNLSLVDPDNRRPVDHARLEAMLRQLDAGSDDPEKLARRLLHEPADGAIKLYVTSQALRFRQAHPLLFAEGSYEPLEARGRAARRVCGFARLWGDEVAIVVAGRFFLGPEAASGFGGTTLALGDLLEGQGRAFRDLLTGRRYELSGEIDLAELLAALPVALLTNDAERHGEAS